MLCSTSRQKCRGVSPSWDTLSSLGCPPRLFSQGGRSSSRILLPLYTKDSKRVFNRKVLPFGVRDHQDARLVAESLHPDEKRLMFDALRKSLADQYFEHKRLGQAVIHSDDYVTLWYVYFVPHLVVGVLHSVNLIFLGDYLQHFGDSAGLSVMGAAGLANVVANVTLLNFGNSVEKWMDKFGLRRPLLSSEQLHNSQVRFVTMLAKLMGMLLGSLCGLVPLLFYDLDPVQVKNKAVAKLVEESAKIEEKGASQAEEGEN